MWKQRILDLAERFEHPAWGIAHCKRVYELALQLAELENVEVDRDALFAAAYLHDAGAFAPYRQEGIDHAERSVQVADEILTDAGFPADRAPLVKEIIRGHMFYADPSPRAEVVLFHDADTLDFMGAIGIARLLSIVGIDDWAPDLGSAIGLIQRFSQELPEKLHTAAAQEMGRARQADMATYLAALAGETGGLETL
jgi:uncharacterized protein